MAGNKIGTPARSGHGTSLSREMRISRQPYFDSSLQALRNSGSANQPLRCQCTCLPTVGVTVTIRRMKRRIQLTTGARLHFGLYALGDQVARQFGGMGAMIELPLSVELEVDRSAEGLSGKAVEVCGSGPLAERARTFVTRWLEAHPEQERSAQVSVKVLASPREHVGLGLGTQLGLTISFALRRLLVSEVFSLQTCAQDVGRGLRSAVGTYGFFYGGLIVDQGKRTGEPLSPLHCRVQIPDEWRWVLLCPEAPLGLAGTAEQQAFDRLPSMTSEQVARLRSIVFESLIPRLATGDYEAFSQSLYSYGRCAGECFAKVQGGAYRTSAIEGWVEQIRSWGFAGVGQSSWGPTVFVLTASESQANQLVSQIKRLDEAMEVCVCKPRNRGVEIEFEG